VDSGAGFYVEEEEFVESQRKEPKLVETPRTNSSILFKLKSKATIISYL
jgi:hypothetical protein